MSSHTYVFNSYVYMLQKLIWYHLSFFLNPSCFIIYLRFHTITYSKLVYRVFAFIQMTTINLICNLYVVVMSTTIDVLRPAKQKCKTQPYDEHITRQVGLP